MNPTQKNQLEENLLERNKPRRAAKPVPLIKQEIVLKHNQKKGNLKTDAEKFAYEAGRAAAELFQPAKGDDLPAEGNQAADILDTIYNGIESGEIYLVTANRILKELERPLRKRNDQLQKKVAAKTKM